MRVMWVAVTLSFLAGVVSAGCGRTSEAAPKAEPSGTARGGSAASTAGSNSPSSAPRAKTRVEVAVLAESRAELELSVPGEVRAVRDARLASPTGGLVEKVFVDEGDSVRKGQVLALVDGALRGIQLEQVKAELEQARREFGRAESLADIGPKADIERAETNVRLLEARVKLARLEVSRATIRAPFTGVVARLGVEEGEVVSPSATMLRLVALDTVEVDLAVPDRDLPAMVVGTEVRIGVGARSDVATGKIVRVLPAGDPETRAFSVKVEADNGDRGLMPGMIANVRIRRTLPEDAMVIPQDWIVTGLRTIGVYVDVDGVARWRPVEVEEIVRDQVVVREGIARGDRLIVAGHRDLSDGDPLLIAREGSCCVGGRARFGVAE
jgi:membrane fusion protein, multidrug efflux system